MRTSAFGRNLCAIERNSARSEARSGRISFTMPLSDSTSDISVIDWQTGSIRHVTSAPEKKDERNASWRAANWAGKRRQQRKAAQWIAARKLSRSESCIPAKFEMWVPKSRVRNAWCQSDYKFEYQITHSSIVIGQFK